MEFLVTKMSKSGHSKVEFGNFNNLSGHTHHHPAIHLPPPRHHLVPGIVTSFRSSRIRKQNWSELVTLISGFQPQFGVSRPRHSDLVPPADRPHRRQGRRQLDFENEMPIQDRPDEERRRGQFQEKEEKRFFRGLFRRRTPAHSTRRFSGNVRPHHALHHQHGVQRQQGELAKVRPE